MTAVALVAITSMLRQRPVKATSRVNRYGGNFSGCHHEWRGN